ncbi:hypothetical protein [Actinoplanes aureus]|uniref:Uncharacterized protein n=1 Tax=Actinoplanes aureus TaxID=2792083 RepID=A0A931CEU6_9ACTN|nr:hypothetical protein [Actinoplanes aureus]MBG0564903.1 hypothetical protein [Actinoplanes aureus]MBG0569086.1 hypothetical protein [Actinoplanes aureus]
MNQAITASLQAWALQATADELHAGPRAADLGGLPAVAADATHLAPSPLFPYLIDIAGRENQTVDESARHLIDKAILHGLAEHDRYSSYLSATTRLIRYPSLTTRLGRPLERVLQQRAEAGTDPEADETTAAIGATALELWLHLCTTQILRPHRLLALLTELPDIVTNAPTEMTKRLPRIAGLAHEHFPDDDLLTLLHRLTGIPDAEADAGFETALADLRRALDADNQDQLVHALAQARTGFAAVEATDEARHDAQTYAAALDAIMAFQRADTAPLRAAANRLRDAVTHHQAWLSGGYLPPWSWARAEAETAWLQLAETLTTAAEPLTSDCWYHPSQAIAALRDAYQAARSFAVHADSNDPHGIELLIRPTIESAFIDDKARLAVLDHALAHDPTFADDPSTQRLHIAVHQALRCSQPSPDAAPAAGKRDGLGKELSRLPAVLHHFGIEDAIELVNNVPARLQQAIESILWNAKIAEAETGNIKIETKLGELQRQLAASPDWIGASAGPFQMLLQQTMLFLVSRHNIGATMGGERTAYLRTTPNSAAALEKPFHQDYKEWISQGPLYNVAQAETIDRGRGRADVLVKFRNVSFCVECKRETTDASKDGLRSYAGQAAVYTDTDIAFAILLVLDLTTPPTGAPDLYSNMWVEQVQREEEDNPRYIVIARLPGKKPDPSATRTPPRRDG